MSYRLVLTMSVFIAWREYASREDRVFNNALATVKDGSYTCGILYVGFK